MSLLSRKAPEMAWNVSLMPHNFLKWPKIFDFFEFLAGQNVTAVQESAGDAMECKSYAPQFFKMTKNFDFFEFLAGQNVTAVQESAGDGMECKSYAPQFCKMTQILIFFWF